MTEEQTNRVRAYSTNNAPLHEQTHFQLQNFAALDENQASNFNTGEQMLNVMPELANRPRAQTYQNGVQSPMPILYNSQQNTISEVPEVLPTSQKLLPSEPLLLDHIDHRLLNWTSTYSDLSLGPTNTLIISNLPPHNITSLSLANLLMRFGRLLTVRLFVGNESAIVEFENLESAMQAKAQLHHQELLPGYSCLVAFAKIFPPQQQQQSRTPNLKPYPQQPLPHNVTPPHDQELPPPQIQIEDIHSEPSPIVKTISSEPSPLSGVVDQIRNYLLVFGIESRSGVVPSILNNALNYKGNDTDLGPLPDPIPIREFDAPKLRETRKLIDAEGMTQFEIEELSLAMLDELPELSSDYLGNTVVQKLFEFSSSPIKHIMLKEVSKYLAQMGAHKNGTWSAQKMINVADTPLQKAVVAESLKPYCGPLFNDQFGNYVIQCSLKFGSPWNDFIFETILAKFSLITQNRFGARAVRACLESHEATVEQSALVSAAIVAYAEHLAIDQNAALLITWFLDTCTLPNRYVLIAQKLLPHLAQLCTHKLASLTILKILNNRNEAEAKYMILDALFGDSSNYSENSRPPQLLEQVLQDSTHGASFIFKVLSNPQLDVDTRKHVVAQVRKVLMEINISPYQNYKRLMDEVGIPNRGEAQGRHNRTHSNGCSNSRNKNRQNKTSPQNAYGNRRSTPNSGYRTQTQAHPVTMVPPPAQPQFNDFPSQMYQPAMRQQYPQQAEIFPFDHGAAQQPQMPEGYGFQQQYGYGAAHY
jgi:protein JSN1